MYAQTEIATLLQAAGVQDVTSIDAVTAPDGSVTYLSTAGVADQVMSKAQAAGEELGTVGIVGFADHAVRCVLTARNGGHDRRGGAEGHEAADGLRPRVESVVDAHPRRVPAHRPHRPAHHALSSVQLES